MSLTIFYHVYTNFHFHQQCDTVSFSLHSSFVAAFMIMASTTASGWHFTVLLKKYIFFNFKVGLLFTEREGEMQREDLHLLVHSWNGCDARAKLTWSWEPEAYSCPSMWVQDPKMALGHLLLLSQVIRRELTGKWNSWHTKWHSHGYCHL